MYLFLQELSFKDSTSLEHVVPLLCILFVCNGGFTAEGTKLEIQGEYLFKFRRRKKVL